jgi:hypothetical protein
MSEHDPQLFRFGVFNPKHFIISVVGDAVVGEQAATALRAAGFPPDDVRVITGDQVLATESSYGDQKGVLSRLAGFFPSEEAAIVDQYVAEAERGAHFVAVKAPEREQRTQARGILAAHGAYAMRYYGENTITDL